MGSYQKALIISIGKSRPKKGYTTERIKKKIFEREKSSSGGGLKRGLKKIGTPREILGGKENILI